MGMIPAEMEFPFSELLLCMGFLFILLTESIVHKLFGGSGHGHSHYPSMENLDGIIVQDATVKIPRVGLDNPSYSPSSRSHTSTTKSSLSHTNVYSVSSASLSSDSDSPSSVSPSKSGKKRKQDSSLLSSLRSFLVILALSIHSLFEGMAIGLEESQSGVWKLFMAVAIHSTAIVFCVGTEMTTTGIRKRSVVLYMSVLSLVTPLGVLVGIAVTVHMEQAGGAHVLLIGALQGVAAGTLLYITFYEVLSRDKLAKYGMSGLFGAIAVLFGFLLMAGMEAGSGGHSHGGGGHDGHNHLGHEGHHHGGHEGHHGGQDGHSEHSQGDLDRAAALLEHQQKWEGLIHKHLHSHQEEQGGQEHQHIHEHKHDHEYNHDHDHEHEHGHEHGQEYGDVITHDNKHEHEFDDKHEHEHEGNRNITGNHDKQETTHTQEHEDHDEYFHQEDHEGHNHSDDHDGHNHDEEHEGHDEHEHHEDQDEHEHHHDHNEHKYDEDHEEHEHHDEHDHLPNESHIHETQDTNNHEDHDHDEDNADTSEPQDAAHSDLTLNDQHGDFFPLNSTDSRYLHDEVSYDQDPSGVTM